MTSRAPWRAATGTITTATSADDLTQDERLRGTLLHRCRWQVTNVNDAPVALATGVSVTVERTAEDAHAFRLADFRYEDEDEDNLVSIIIETVPTAGTMRVGTTEVATGNVPYTVPVADVGAITFYPEASQDPTDTSDLTASYATFTFKVVDDGMDPDANTNTESAAATISIRLTTATQMDASGMPTVTPAADPTAGWAEDAELTAALTGVVEPNGIDEASIAWQWQSAAAPASGTPAAAAWSDIADATDTTFTPLQAHVGMHIRACVSFADQHATPAREGPLCSTSAQVSNVNDAPTSAGSSVNAFTIATADDPFRFSADNFPFMDEDAGQDSGGALASITLAALPTLGTLRVGDDNATVGQVVMPDALDTISWYPPQGAEAADEYDEFRFTVSDGIVSSIEYAIVINLVLPGQLPATGAPSVSGTVEQNAELTAVRGTVADVNGVDESTIGWQWQFAPPGADGAVPGEDSEAWANITDATAATFTPLQAHVGMHLRACMNFADLFVDPQSNTPAPGMESRCSAATVVVANVNDAPVATDQSLQAPRPEGSDTITIPVSVFLAAYSDPDGDADSLESVAITTPPPVADGILQYNGAPVAAGDVLSLNDAGTAFADGALTFAINAGVQSTSLGFTLSDGEASSGEATLSITFGRDINEEQVKMLSAILSVAATTNATNAISAAMAGAAGPASGFDLSMGGTSLARMGRSLHSNLGPGGDYPVLPGDDNAELPQAIATADQRAWYLGTADAWQYNAAYNAADDSAGAIVRRLRALADGDLAMQYSSDAPSSLRIWGRYQRLEISGNPMQDDGTELRYDGNSDGFYVGGDRLFTDTIRIGLAMGFDGADINLDLDGDGSDDAATRKATAFYPYMRVALGDANELRIIAGVGQGDLQMTSSLNRGLADADLSWNMLAASFRHARELPGRMSGSVGGAFQTSSSSISEGEFLNGAKIQAAESSSGEFSIDAELNYDYGGIDPFASLTARKWSGDLEQSLAMDLSLGADLSAGPLALRLAATRQLNSTTHERHAFSMDFSLAPNTQGLSASFGNSWDSLSGRPQWNTKIRWQRRSGELALAASPAELRLHGKLRW